MCNMVLQSLTNLSDSGPTNRAVIMYMPGPAKNTNPTLKGFRPNCTKKTIIILSDILNRWLFSYLFGEKWLQGWVEEGEGYETQSVGYHCKLDQGGVHNKSISASQWSSRLIFSSPNTMKGKLVKTLKSNLKEVPCPSEKPADTKFSYYWSWSAVCRDTYLSSWPVEYRVGWRAEQTHPQQ